MVYIPNRIVSHNKNQSPNICYNLGGPQKPDDQRKEPDTKADTWYDPINRKYPEQVNAQRQKLSSITLPYQGSGVEMGTDCKRVSGNFGDHGRVLKLGAR